MSSPQMHWQVMVSKDEPDYRVLRLSLKEDMSAPIAILRYKSEAELVAILALLGDLGHSSLDKASD